MVPAEAMTHTDSHAIDALTKTIWPDGLPRACRDRWSALCSVRDVEPGDVLVRQRHPARTVQFVVTGRVRHMLQLDARQEQIDVGRVAESGFPLGWSGFVPPHRYATSAQALSAGVVLVWPIDALNRLFERWPRAGERFFHYIFATVQPLLATARGQLDATPAASDLLRGSLAAGSSVADAPDRETIVRVLRQAPFLEVFDAEQIDALAGHATTTRLRAGETAYRRGDKTGQLAFLVDGIVEIRAAGHDGREIFLRSYNSVGQVVAGSEFDAVPVHQETAVALTDTTLLRIDRADVQRLGARSATFGLQLARRWLWLLNGRLRTLRVHLLAQQCNDESVVIQDLIDQVSPQLGVDSALYKLPHLLARRLTHAEAFACLDAVQHDGTALERTLAGLCRELLAGTERELRFHDALKRVYRIVTTAADDQPPDAVRHASCVAFQQAFKHTRYVINGRDRLPPRAGHIVILNHLISHPDYALANGFEFALDTHFVSSMILEPAYGDCGVRVVRRGRGEEHGHHSYYDRLGHIYVYTAESDAPHDDDADAITRRERFTRIAGDCLRSGRNLVVCPEGTSNRIEDSPSAFKKGTFHLAAALDPEPLIVPVAVVNIDRRLKDAVLAAVVHEPFRISERCDPHDRDSLEAFLRAYRERYRNYVDDALAIADAAG